MSVGLLLVTHNQVGVTLLETASRMLERVPLRARTLEVAQDSDLTRMRLQARRLIRELDEGQGVLVLTDMFGSTPANLATRLVRDGEVAVVAGLNLPMLVRVLNYSQLGLAHLVGKAVSGGRDGVLQCEGDG